VKEFKVLDKNPLRFVRHKIAIFVVLMGVLNQPLMAQTQVVSQTHLIANQAELSITHPSGIGCLNAHLEEDAKTPIFMIPIDDDLSIPMGGVLGAS
jgi:hypothetical protein